MINLDEYQSLVKLDKSNMLASIKALPLQFSQTWSDVKKIKIPDSYKNFSNILVNGMGGSAIGPRIVRSVFYDSLKVPFEIRNNYFLPAYVNENTLLILSSYSGTTEEILWAAKEAIVKKAKILGITTGSDLAKFLQECNIPYFLIDPKNNPSGQPRMGLGYSIAGIIGLLNSCGLLNLADKDILLLTEILQKINAKFGVKISTGKNSAKAIAQKSFGKIMIIVGADFLSGSISCFRNQIHENSKNFSDFFIIPELNHHLLESLSNPKTNPQNLIFLFISSDLYPSQIKKRMEITKKVVSENQIKVLDYHCFSQNRLCQAIEAVHLGSYVSFYLAMLNHLDPTPILWVDYFKKELNQ